MKLRYSADWRTIVWAFGLMPGLVAAHVALAARLPPRASLLGALLLLPFSMYAAYCAGVIAHNHNHSPTFTRRNANCAFSIWISIFYGYPTFAWIPTHNENHHRYVNAPGDATITAQVGADGAWAAFRFFFASSASQAPLIRAFIARMRAKNRGMYALIIAEYAIVIGAHVAACAAAMAFFGLAHGALVYAASLGVPAGGALWGLMFTNYVQHVGCEAESDWNHSRNFVSPWMNWLVFDNGFHTAHHEKPGLHWSKLRQEHARLADRIDPRLNESSIPSFCWKRYIARGFAPARATRTVSHASTR